MHMLKRNPINIIKKYFNYDITLLLCLITLFMFIIISTKKKLVEGINNIDDDKKKVDEYDAAILAHTVDGLIPENHRIFFGKIASKHQKELKERTAKYNYEINLISQLLDRYSNIDEYADSIIVLPND